MADQKVILITGASSGFGNLAARGIGDRMLALAMIQVASDGGASDDNTASS